MFSGSVRLRLFSSLSHFLCEWLGPSSAWSILTPHSFIWYNARSQHSIFDEVLEADEHADLDRRDDLAKPKFTFTECIVALVLSLAIVTLLAVFLVERIEDVVEAGIPDQFLGLIMLPLVEKAAEHLTAIDEAWDGQIVCFGHHFADVANLF
jgi:Ca2+/H+ antiporter